MSEQLVIGIDYGTDSARALLVDAVTGEELALSVKEYSRWKKGLYCDPADCRFRHHPADYIEALEYILKDVVAQVPGSNKKVKGIAIDVTCSTPVAVNKAGIPLALLPAMQENPNGMFILWKDHTGVDACKDINDFSRTHKTDYTRYAGGGGNYSAEHYWAKVLHILRTDEAVKEECYSFVEACDWLTGLLTGNNDPQALKRNICTAGFKKCWNPAWGGYPPNEFFTALDPVLDGMVDSLHATPETCDRAAGTLCPEWAEKTGLPTHVVIGIGNIDAHAGAIGAGVKDKSMVEIIGTSTCTITVGPKSNSTIIPGISGQADDSIIPGMIGYEAGQAAFGDLFAWFKNLLSWPLLNIASGNCCDKTIGEITAQILPELSRQAALLENREKQVLATDWVNGRRTPDVDYSLTCSMTGLTLATDAPAIFKALVEAAAFGSKAIVEQFRTNGIEIEEIIAVGGITRKSPYVMQVLADVIGMPIKVVATYEACALGSAICAAVAAGIYSTIPEAQEKMGDKNCTIYTPNPNNHNFYKKKYPRYKAMEK